MRDIHAYDYNGGYYDAEIVSDLFHLKCVTDVTEEKQVVSVEIDTEKYHKYGNNPLQINIVAAKLSFLIPKPPVPAVPREVQMAS